MDLSNINFWSRKNYMKRALWDSILMDAPQTASAKYGYATTVPIKHNLGYTPLFRVGFEPNKDGRIYMRGSSGPTGTPTLVAYPNDTSLTLILHYPDNTLTGKYPVHYVIYWDYRLV